MLMHPVAEQNDALGVLRSPSADSSLGLVGDEGAGEGNHLLGQLVPLNRLSEELVVEGDLRFRGEEE